ncbi:hypothetical protein OHA27_13725 [Streptomyces sp. NBC_01619]|uniref:Uncharacterized protein n=1 Tax=Streptomyces pratisoli TaxID=3139917 RepID=A0ACC6QHF5_9ACTN|nr:MULTISPECIES: hypothetical protein [unclassified Streptomyces]MCX4511347.1 hypothetical protein [Streptomyces sp. NBC_01619]
MPRTTPPRPVDIEAIFPDLSAYRGTATRLHPRPGTPGETESSVGGPLLWPADEPWPVCTEPHARGAERLDDVRLRRRILDEAWRRSPSGPNEEERQLLASLEGAHSEPSLKDTEPVPLLPLAQLHRRDVPGLVSGPEGCDLLQVLWCPFDAHGGGYELSLHLRWRRSSEVTDVLADRPEPLLVGSDAFVAEPCVLHPERVVEHVFPEVLPEELQERIYEWEGDEDEQDEDSILYQSDLSIAPGWKVGGFPGWPSTGPVEMTCECGERMELLLSVDSREWDNGTRSWIPLEDVPTSDVSGANIPTRVTVGRGGVLHVFICTADPTHAHRLNVQ